AVSLYLLALAVSWSEPADMCAIVGPDCTEAAATAVLAQIGLTPTAAGLYAAVFYDIGLPLGGVVMGIFLFWRRRDRPIAVATAAVLVLYGLIVNSDAVDIALWTLGLPGLVDFYHLAFEALLIYMLLTFPTGRFTP